MTSQSHPWETTKTKKNRTCLYLKKQNKKQAKQKKTKKTRLQGKKKKHTFRSNEKMRIKENNWFAASLKFSTSPNISDSRENR